MFYDTICTLFGMLGRCPANVATLFNPGDFLWFVILAKEYRDDSLNYDLTTHECFLMISYDLEIVKTHWKIFGV